MKKENKTLVVYFSYIGDTLNVGMVEKGNNEFLAKYGGDAPSSEVLIGDKTILINSEDNNNKATLLCTLIETPDNDFSTKIDGFLLFQNELYTNLSIGTPKQNIISILKMDKYGFLIY